MEKHTYSKFFLLLLPFPPSVPTQLLKPYIPDLNLHISTLSFWFTLEHKALFYNPFAYIIDKDDIQFLQNSWLLMLSLKHYQSKVSCIDKVWQVYKQ